MLTLDWTCYSEIHQLLLTSVLSGLAQLAALASYGIVISRLKPRHFAAVSICSANLHVYSYCSAEKDWATQPYVGILVRNSSGIMCCMTMTLCCRGPPTKGLVTLTQSDSRFQRL